MRLVSFVHHGVAGVGVASETGVAPLTSYIAASSSSELSPMRRFLTDAAGDVTGYAADLARGTEITWDDLTVSAVIPDPAKIVAAPVNYVDHQQEMNEDYHIDSLGIFLKATSSVTGAGGTVVLPYTDRRFDQEGELAVVIGRPARFVSPEDAMSHIAGFTCLLDITMRGGEDRSTRKSFDTFTPVGPWLVTPDEVGDPGELTLECSVNGVLRQRASISDLIWSIPRLVSYASSVMTLLPGDVVTSGTPAGVGVLEDGDTIEVVIDRVGRLAVSVSARDAVVCPTRGARRGPVPPPDVTPITSPR